MKRPGGFDGAARPPRVERRVAPRLNASDEAAPRVASTVVPSVKPSAVEERVELAVNEPEEQRQSHDEPSAAVRNLPAAAGAAAPLAATSEDGVPRARRLLKVRRREIDTVKLAEKRVRLAERSNRRGQRRETRRFTSGVRRARRRALIVTGAVLALVLFVLVGTFTPIMSVRTVEVVGAQAVNVDDLKTALERFEGKPLALVEENEILHALSTFPLIQRFAVERVPPSTLVIRIEERVPVIALDVEGVVRLYDAAGVLVGESKERPTGVPLGDGSLRNTSSAAFRATSQVVKDMPDDLRQQVVAAKAATGQDVTFNLASGIEVFWGNDRETKRKSLVLQTMLSSLEGREVAHIDVSSTDAPIFR